MKPARFGTPYLLAIPALLLAAPGWAAIGDNAPPIPSTYNTNHPRLPHPDQAFLAGLAANSTALTRYNADADAWDSTNPGGFIELRRLVIAYQANKIANPAKAATYFAKIKSLADLGGTWGPLLYAVNDGVGNGTYTLTAASANFLTGCGGGSCQGQILSIDARTYIISSISSANTVVLNASNPPPNGSNLKIRVFSTIGFANLNLALIYDWLYHDLDADTRAEFLKQLEVLCTLWEENYIGVGASPYNDVFYIRLGTFGIIGALAIYPDHPKSTQHMRFMTDVWFNYLLPVWKQVFGPEGGGWHEGWPDYVNGMNGGMTAFIVPSLLSWQTATGDPIFTRERWLKNFAYFTIYITKPDLVVERIGDSSRPYLTGEYDLRIGAKLGSLNGLAEIYNDPVVRGWARFLNKEFPAGPDGFEPSAWPFYKPDNNSNAVAPLSALPTTHDFTGWGVLSMRTGWTEDDSFATLKYGANFWSHEHFDTGAFTIFSRGNLAIDSGSYRAGSASKHQNQYGRQTIAHNALTITDPADVYPTTTFWTVDENGQSIYLAPPNDGGQRRVGTGYNLRFPQFVSPSILGDWLRNWEYYHTGKMVALATTPNYTYTAVDITAAYNNRFSITTPNATNRTHRVSKAVRHMLFIPRGTAAYVVIFDQVVSTNASFVKRWLLHSINQPTIAGNKFVIARNELITPKPYSDLWPGKFSDYLKYDSGSGASSRYKYDGKLYGWMVQPQAGQINVVGGPGKEFWVEDPLNPGTGANWNQCQLGQCATNEGMGAVTDFINPEAQTSPQEPGSWRIEQKPAQAATNDVFLNVMLATNTADSNVPVDVTTPAGLPADTAGATWVDNDRRYTVTFTRDGIGGQIKIEGVVDEGLLSRARQLPDRIEMLSGTGQSAPANRAVASPLTVRVKDSAGNPVPNAVVHFGVTQGNGWLATDMATTDASGQASAILTLGPGTAGALTNVMAYVNGLAPVEFVATISSGSPTAPVVSSLTCTPATLSSAVISSCTVTLSQAASAGGAGVTLSSSTPALAVPSTVTVPPGSTSASFSATAGSISITQSAIVTATLNGTSTTMSLTLQAVTGTPALTLLSCSPTGINAGSSATCTATLSQPAASSATVTLASNSPALTVPAMIAVPAGAMSASFTVLAGSVSTSLSVTVTATFGGISKAASLTVIPLTEQTGGTSVPVNTWIMIPTRGFPVQSVGFEKLVYAPTPVKKAVMLGNYQQFGSEPNQSLIAYDFETNYWSVLDIGESFHSESMPEAGHPVGGFAYDPNQKKFIYNCCMSGANQPENLYDTWWFDFLGQTGRSKRAWPKPGAIMQHGSAFDALNNMYVLQGGDSFVGTWIYNPLTNTYQHRAAQGTPPNPSVNLPSMAYNTTDHKVYLFGGQIGAGFSNELFKYDVATDTWTKLNPAGEAPSPRWRNGFAYDSTNGVFLVYGGQDDTQIYNDSWIYNPNTNAWTKLNPSQSPPLGTVGPFETLAYDSDHNVFILVLRGSGGYANGASLSYPAQTWLFRYQGAGPNAGTQDSSLQPAPGAINRNVDAWAKEPSLAASGDTLYAAWVETGKPFDRSNSAWFHVYAKRRQEGVWAAMGASPTSLDSEFNNYSESHSPSIASVAGVPWISWYKWNNSGETWALWAKSWDGSAWQGGLVGRVGPDKARAFQGRSQMADVGGVPYIAFLEVDKSFFPQRTFAYVKSWVGGQWVLKGIGALNMSPSVNTTASSISIASKGTDIYVAWTEYTSDNLVKTHTPAQVFVAKWSGGQWVRIGGSLNVNATSWADDVSIACLNGQPYAAWTERSVSGEAQLFVKTLIGGNWVLSAPGSMNKNTHTGWAFRPSLAADDASGSLYLAWVEQQALGQRAQTYVTKLSGGAWTALGDSLNADPALGSAGRVSLAMVGGQPVAAWGEVNFGSLRQVFVKRWDGSSWMLLDDPPPQVSCDLNGDGVINNLDVQSAINQALGLAPCHSADLQQNGKCNAVSVQRVINASIGGVCVIGQ